MSVKTTLIALMCIFFNIALKGQNYTSMSGGVWTDPANWNNTSEWGTPTPPLAGHDWGTITLQHNMSIASGYTLASATLNIMNGSTLSIAGNMNTSGGGTNAIKLRPIPVPLLERD